MDSLIVGLVDEDKVCENCGQIFSCEAAFLEHRRRNSCLTSHELLIDTTKALRSPIEDYRISATNYEAIHQHHETAYNSMDAKMRIPRNDDEQKRYDEKIHSEANEVKLHSADSEPTRWLSTNCPIVGRTYAVNESERPAKEVDLWSDFNKIHRDTNIKPMGDERRCDMEKCNWSDQSEAERSVHQRLCNDTTVKPKLHMEESGEERSVRANKRCAIVRTLSGIGKRGAVFGDDYDVVCCVQNCSVSRKMLKPDGRPYEFFSFPKNATRLARWTAIANPRFPNFQPRPIDAICEKHFRKQDLLCAKPSLMDGADPHRDESMGEEDDETDQPTRTDKKESAGFAHGKVDMCAMSGESMGTTISAKDSIPNHAVCSTIRSGHNRYDRDALDFISEDEEIDAGAESAQLCCLSEIPMMKRRAKRMEKQCDTLFLMLRTLLQSTHAEELLRRKQEEEILTAERINLTYPQITDFEARQMNALRALAEMESAKAALRIERKDSATDLHSNRRKEQLPSASRSDDELEVLVDGKVVEQHEGDARKDETTIKDRRKLKVVKGQSVIRAHPLESSNLPVSETPRIDEENAVILHPTQNRLLEKKEIRFYIARAILCLKTTEITKSRIRMLAPSWMQIADDADILAAIDELKSAGLLVLTGDAKAGSKLKCDVYEKADWRKIADIQAVLTHYGLPPDMLDERS